MSLLVIQRYILAFGKFQVSVFVFHLPGWHLKKVLQHWSLDENVLIEILNTEFKKEIEC